MSQSATLVAALVAAFVLFIAARGRLGAYGAALWGAKSSGSSSGGSSSGGSSVGSTLKTVGTVAEIASYF